MLIDQSAGGDRRTDRDTPDACDVEQVRPI